MFIFLSIVLGVVFYLVMCGATHGYAKHYWPHTHSGVYGTTDRNEDKRLFATIFWPFYWVFIWPCTKANEITFSHIEKEAAKQVARNNARVADLQATRAQLEASNAELEQAEVELEKEIGNL